jgi:hypothetical protein
LDIEELMKRLGTRSHVATHSSDKLAQDVKEHIRQVDKKREKEKPDYCPRRKIDVTPVPHSEHDGGIDVSPWDVMMLLSRATVLSSQGASQALSQHWNSLKYLSAFRENPHGHLELSAEGRSREFFRKSVQAQELGTAFGLATVLNIARRRHPGYRFTIAQADLALEAGWTLRGGKSEYRLETRDRPDYFLVGLHDRKPMRFIAVRCKGEHTGSGTRLNQFARATEEVYTVATGPKNAPEPAPSLMTATALDGKSGIEVHILDPEGDGVLVHPSTVELNRPVEQQNFYGEIPVPQDDGKTCTRPGFHLPPEYYPWFSRVLVRSAAASLLAFAGDRSSAKGLLTERQGARIGDDFLRPGASVHRDTGITLADLRLVGTDHVFRFHGERVEVFSALPEQLYETLRDQDLENWETARITALRRWRSQRRHIRDGWSGLIVMDDDGAVLGIRKMGEGRPLDD